MSNEHEQKQQNNNEGEALCEKCKKIRPSVISMLALVPEYVTAIKSFNGNINDEVLYDILRQELKKMSANGTVYRTARRIMNKVSRDVKGDSVAWQIDTWGKQIGFPSENYNGIGFLFKKVNITHTLLEYWMTVPKFIDHIKVLQAQSATINESMVLEIMKEIYSQELSDKESGLESDFKFYPAKRALRELSLKLTGDRDAWEN